MPRVVGLVKKAIPPAHGWPCVVTYKYISITYDIYDLYSILQKKKSKKVCGKCALLIMI
jgi:hypothetical protein